MSERLLQLWRDRLSPRERDLLMSFGLGTESKAPKDLPAGTTPSHIKKEGPLLRTTSLLINHTNKKTLHKACVRVFDRKTLEKRATCARTSKMGDVAPHWRVLHKPPLKKRTGDLQWQVLHAAIASNAFISVFNPAVFNQCPFCSSRFYTFFIDCNRLT